MNLSDLDLSALQDVMRSMSSEDMDALKSMAASMFSQQEAPKTPPPKPEDAALPFDLESLGKIASLLSALKSDGPDPRRTLLYALRPMLNEERQHKVDQAARMLQLFSILPKLKELNL